ncbi:hypothetical protein BDV23DRAFT_177870 [Aspergillus alliaceus]|uniref:Uncharacterized protein n=1 Tax=Petromyces alliaceus TaxID=209559 RepID=A0A5N7CPX3_PETAA|nr:hypothetical protein BDV23DRAFT_177870 [Aspergillus alliaceus]
MLGNFGPFDGIAGEQASCVPGLVLREHALQCYHTLTKSTPQGSRKRRWTTNGDTGATPNGCIQLIVRGDRASSASRTTQRKVAPRSTNRWIAGAVLLAIGVISIQVRLPAEDRTPLTLNRSLTAIRLRTNGRRSSHEWIRLGTGIIGAHSLDVIGSSAVGDSIPSFEGYIPVIKVRYMSRCDRYVSQKAGCVFRQYIHHMDQARKPRWNCAEPGLSIFLVLKGTRMKIDEIHASTHKIFQRIGLDSAMVDR